MKIGFPKRRIRLNSWFRNYNRNQGGVNFRRSVAIKNPPSRPNAKEVICGFELVAKSDTPAKLLVIEVIVVLIGKRNRTMGLKVQEPLFPSKLKYFLSGTPRLRSPQPRSFWINLPPTPSGISLSASSVVVSP